MRKTLLAILSVLLLTLAGCAAPAAPQADPVSDEGSSEPTYRLAALFPGPISDADYNTLGYNGIQAVGEEFGIDVAFSESVAVPDADRVMREYIDDGYNIIFTHGSQFVNPTVSLANEFPDVVFIGESDAPATDPPPNLWIIDRNFHVGFYAIGALAARASQSGKVGYIGGLTLPFSYAEVHAIEQAIADAGLDVTVQPVWAGDFNDPSKARELADAMIADGVNVIVGSLNAGMFGIFEAAKNAGTPVYVTAKYTDKSSFAEGVYLSSLLYDFVGPLQAIVSSIQAGETGGYYPLGFDTGVALQGPIDNVTDEVAAEVEQIVAQLEGGEIEVAKNTEPVE